LDFYYYLLDGDCQEVFTSFLEVLAQIFEWSGRRFSRVESLDPIAHASLP
jgi:hypothetical protein